MQNPRQLAFLALRTIHRGAFADAALDRVLRSGEINPPDSPETLRDSPKETLRDRGLVTELVYGTVRRQRSLDALITQLGKKRAEQQPPIFAAFCTWVCTNCVTSTRFRLVLQSIRQWN